MYIFFVLYPLVFRPHLLLCCSVEPLTSQDLWSRSAITPGFLPLWHLWIAYLWIAWGATGHQLVGHWWVLWYGPALASATCLMQTLGLLPNWNKSISWFQSLGHLLGEPWRCWTSLPSPRLPWYVPWPHPLAASWFVWHLCWSSLGHAVAALVHMATNPWRNVVCMCMCKAAVWCSLECIALWFHDLLDFPCARYSPVPSHHKSHAQNHHKLNSPYKPQEYY